MRCHKIDAGVLLLVLATILPVTILPVTLLPVTLLPVTLLPVTLLPVTLLPVTGVVAEEGTKASAFRAVSASCCASGDNFADSISKKK